MGETRIFKQPTPALILFFTMTFASVTVLIYLNSRDADDRLVQISGIAGLNKKCMQLINEGSMDSAIYYAEIALEMAEEIDYPMGAALTLNAF